MKKQRKLSRALGFFVVLGCFGYFIFANKSHDNGATQKVDIQATQPLVEAEKIASLPQKPATSVSTSSKRSKKHTKLQNEKTTKTITEEIATVPTTKLSGEEFNAGLGDVELRNNFPPLQVDIRIGSLAPNFGIVLDLTALPINIGGQDFATRFGIGAVKSGSEWNASLYVDELMYFNTNNPYITFYAGAGVNIPLVDDAKLGLNILTGAEHKTSLFNNKNESLFIELGASNYNVEGMSDDLHFTVAAGYKFSL